MHQPLDQNRTTNNIATGHITDVRPEVFAAQIAPNCRQRAACQDLALRTRSLDGLSRGLTG